MSTPEIDAAMEIGPLFEALGIIIQQWDTRDPTRIEALETARAADRLADCLRKWECRGVRLTDTPRFDETNFPASMILLSSLVVRFASRETTPGSELDRMNRSLRSLHDELAKVLPKEEGEGAVESIRL